MRASTIVLQFAAAYFNTEPVDDWDPASPTFKNNKAREEEDRIQADFIFKF